MTLQEIIAKRMAQLKMSATELAAASGLTDAYISGVLSGKQDNPTARTICALARALRISEARLIRAACANFRAQEQEAA